MTGVIDIIGSIGLVPEENGLPQKGIELRDVIKAVKEQGEIDSLLVRVASYGGNEKESNDIFNYLRELPYDVVTKQVGPIASAGVKVFLAGKKKRIYDPKYEFFIHNTRLPLSNTSIDKNDAAEILNALTKSTENLINFYSRETGNPASAFIPYMDKQTSLKGDEPLIFGFATENVNEEEEVLNIYNKSMDIKEVMKKISAFISPVAAKELPLKDGQTVVTVEAAEGEDLIGKPAKVGDAAAPDGEHELADGKILVVEGGLVKEIKAAPEVEVEDKKYKEMQANFDKLAQAVNTLIEAQTQSKESLVNLLDEKITALKSTITTGHTPAIKSVEKNEVHLTPIQKKMTEKLNIK